MTGDGGPDPDDDPDVIELHEPTVWPAPGAPGLLSSGIWGTGVPLAEPTKSTPLEDDVDDGAIPAAPLWAMKYQRHFRLVRRDEDEIRTTLGAGDGAIYVINDGRKRVMISRLVGTTPDGCLYCLVGGLTIAAYEQYTLGGHSLDDVFSDARDIALCAVFDAGQAVSNVTLAETFASADEVPSDYLPPHPLIRFEGIPDGLG